MTEPLSKEQHARFRHAVMAEEPWALKRVAKAWKGKTARVASIELDVTEATLRRWKRTIAALAEMLEG